MPPGNHAHSFKAKFIYVPSYVNSIRCDTSLEVKTKGTLERSLWHTRVLSPLDAWVSSSTAELLNYARLLLILSLGTCHFICLTLSWHLRFAKSSFLFKSVYLLVFSGKTFFGHPPARTVLCRGSTPSTSHHYSSEQGQDKLWNTIYVKQTKHIYLTSDLKSSSKKKPTVLGVDSVGLV